MNRKRKMNAILNKKIKKMNAKLQHNNKPRYISKAERAEIEAAQAQADSEEQQTPVT
ncbi:MAG: DUF2986 domain-containing protein [Gammaproteobacteria bacterium]|nr:DUF2986 domain-containing protein [Gammaproteobacteria bacterium]